MQKTDKERLRGCLDVHEFMTASERYIYNPMAYVMLRGIVHTRITPNQLTYFWGILMVVCSVGFLFGNFWIDILCALGWVAAYAIDCADGPLARYTGLKSPRGDYLDGVNHRATYPLLMGFIGYSGYMWGRTEYFGIHFEPVLYLVLGIVAGVCMVLIIDMGNIYNRVCPDRAIDSNAEGAASIEGRNLKDRRLYRTLMPFSPTSFENMMVLIPVFAVLGALDVFIIGYGLIYGLGGFVRYLSFLRMIPGVKKQE